MNSKPLILKPGQYYASQERIVFRTLLGSCIAACLWDESTGIAGMNHFLLANRRYARHMPVCRTEAGKYGVHAMELLINRMLDLGANRTGIKAKVFGGASLLSSGPEDNFFCVGEVNSRFILEFLKTDGIPLVACDLGGDMARVIHFASGDFSVYVRKIKKSTRSRIAQKEHTFWEGLIENQEVSAREPELWL